MVSVAFDANTGRVASKTWPSNYQAAYGYTALGYLKTVTGGGTNGFTQTVSYAVQAMNAQGQITQYRYGNQSPTVKTVEPNTQRLTSQTATLDGQATGNVLNHAYSYDSVGNLTARNDRTPHAAAAIAAEPTRATTTKNIGRSRSHTCARDSARVVKTYGLAPSKINNLPVVSAAS